LQRSNEDYVPSVTRFSSSVTRFSYNLDDLPRTYSPDLYHQKCDAVYQHVFESYQGQCRSLYTAVHQGTGTGSTVPSSASNPESTVVDRRPEWKIHASCHAARSLLRNR